ncbi:MAG: hypothetical protein NTZ14_09425 [Hyphomicrobiales bacterium]|nr:hypothetical protein [Hyphomicrobiales bacterium]
MAKAVYFVTDIEADGPDLSADSMISFATAAVSDDGQILGSFTRNLRPRPDRKPNKHAMSWWRTQPEVYFASTIDPVEPAVAVEAFAGFVEGVDCNRVFAARALLFDGSWIDEDLKTFVGSRVFGGPFEGRHVFTGNGLDIESYLQGLFGWDHVLADDCDVPRDGLGDVEHTHRAIDDAMGYAHVLARALKIGRAQPVRADDFLRHSDGLSA